MTRIKIEDLPVQRELTAEEIEAIVGAGRFMPRIEELEERKMMSATPSAPAMPPGQLPSVTAMFHEGTAPTVAATTLKNAFHDSDLVAANVMLAANYGPSSTVEALNAVYRDNAKADAAILFNLGVSPAKTSAALQDGAKASDVQVAQSMYDAGFSYANIGQGLAYYGDTEVQVAALLKPAGSDQVAKALQGFEFAGSQVDTDGAQAAHAMQQAGFTNAQIGNVLGMVYSDVDGLAVAALQHAGGFTPTAIGQALQGYGDSDADAAAAIRGFSPAAVALVLQTYKDNPLQATIAMQSGGFNGAAIFQVLQQGYGASDGAVIQAMQQANLPTQTFWEAFKAMGYSDASAAAVMQQLSFTPAAIGQALQQGWGDNQIQAASAMRTAGFDVATISQVLQQGYGATAAQAAVVALPDSSTANGPGAPVIVSAMTEASVVWNGEATDTVLFVTLVFSPVDGATSYTIFAVNPNGTKTVIGVVNGGINTDYTFAFQFVDPAQQYCVGASNAAGMTLSATVTPSYISTLTPAERQAASDAFEASTQTVRSESNQEQWQNFEAEGGIKGYLGL
jgi:hypothetical protein